MGFVSMDFNRREVFPPEAFPGFFRNLDRERVNRSLPLLSTFFPAKPPFSAPASNLAGFPATVH